MSVVSTRRDSGVDPAHNLFLLDSLMDIQFEVENVPVRALALPEFLECYLHDRNNDPYKNPLDPRDENSTKRVFALYHDFRPLDDTSHVDGAALTDFQRFLIQQTGRGGLPFSRGYCNTLLKFFKTVFYWGANQRPPIITEARAMTLARVRALPPSPKIRENKQRKDVHLHIFKTALLKFDESRPIISDMLRLEFLNAMRPGEVVNIIPYWIDYNHPQGWHYNPAHHKTSGRGHSRDFIFKDASQTILKKYLVDRNSEKPIFVNRLGNPFTTCTFDKAILKGLKMHGLTRFTPYQLRHAAATWIDEQIDERHAQAYLGHADPIMTRRYIHNELKKIHRTAGEIESILASEVIFLDELPSAEEICPGSPNFTGGCYGK